MGLHVCVCKEDEDGHRVEHPEWDYIRHSGDRELPDLMTIKRLVGHPFDAEYWQRPQSPSDMRAKMDEMHPENSERWAQLESILTDGEWWVYFSY